MTHKLSLRPSPLHLRVGKPLSCPHLGRKHPAKGPGTCERKKSVQGLSQVSIPHEMGIQDDHTTCQNNSPKGKISLQSCTAVCVTSNFIGYSPSLLLVPSLFVTHPPPIFPQASTFYWSPGQHLGLSVCACGGGRLAAFTLMFCSEQKHRRWAVPAYVACLFPGPSSLLSRYRLPPISANHTGPSRQSSVTSQCHHPLFRFPSLSH